METVARIGISYFEGSVRLLQNHAVTMLLRIRYGYDRQKAM
jgi:hypothetical protein